MPLFFHPEFWETMRLAMRFNAVVFPDGIIGKSSAEVCIKTLKQASQGVKARRATVALIWRRGIKLTTLSQSELKGGVVYINIKCIFSTNGNPSKASATPPSIGTL